MLLARASHLQPGFVACRYHLSRIERLENEIRFMGERHADELAAIGGTFSFACAPMDFEYHGFLFALSRSLNYLSRAVAHYFGRECQSFRRLAKAISSAPPEDRRRAVQKQFEVAAVAFSLDRADRRPVRDEVAHYRPVSSGAVNIMQLGGENGYVVTLEGSREADGFVGIGSSEELPLSRALGGQLHVAEECALAMLDALSAQA